MSTSMLFHALNIRDFHYCNTKYVKNNIIFLIKPHKVRCSVCKSTNVVSKGGKKKRKLKAGRIGRKQIILETEIHKVERKDCQTIRQFDMPFAEPKKTYT